MNLRLIRLEGGLLRPTVGVLEGAGELLCWTLELPWLENLEDESCIPSGRYVWRGMVRGDGKFVYRLEGVAGRSGIDVHVGNTVKDTTGCILVGRVLGRLRGERAVLGSEMAMTELKLRVGGEGSTGWVTVMEQFRGGQF